MDPQGANFAFDMNLDMDFTNVFTKPSEDNTSAGIFGDEGIDATFSQGFDLLNPMLNTTSQEQAFMPQLTMDNTSRSTSMWNGQLTPQSQNALNSFPPTPMQSFDTMFEQPSTLGKRALQLDAEDFPSAKRLHETMDFSLFSPSSSWTLDVQPTPPSAITFGLTDEAADMCAMWFNKYAILPSDRHINSLSQLTGESADAVRHWFGRMLKQGMGNSQGDSAYKSQTAMIPDDQFWNNLSDDVMQMPQIASRESTQEFIATPDVPSVQQTPIAAQAANTLRSGKKQRCSPTEDRSLLSRDPEKIYQCTRKCGKRYGRKCDWKRNEEEGYPCRSWVCSLCTGEGAENVKPCFRKYHFAQHFRNIHPGLDCDEYEETSVIASETDFPRQCGFCTHRFQSRQERIDHIADHFKQGKCMLDWNDNGGDDNNDSDNNDDSDDGSDGSAPPRKPPQYDPGGAANKKHFGGGNDGGSSGGSGPQGGFFQWQLSQLNQRSSIPRSSPADQRNKPSEVLQRLERGLRASSKPPLQSPPGLFDESGEAPPEPGTAEKHDKNTLAGDGVSKPLAAMDNVHGQWYGVRTDVLLNRDLSKSSVPTATATFSLDQQRECRAPNSPRTQGGSDLAHVSDILEARTTPAPSAKLDYQELLSLKNAAKTAASAHALTAWKSGASHEHSLRDSKILQTIPETSRSFRSLRLLGSGGFSTVDEVVHRDTNLRLGRKTLKNRDPAALKELLKEVNVLQKLRHPHVIRFLGAYSKGDKMSILISPVADTTLALWLDRHLTQPPNNLAQVVTKMFGCLASSVRYLHEQRPVIKHLDIKPQNILVVEDDGEFPHVVLCDFGISSVEELAEEQSQPLTRHYVAPEVFEGFTRKQAADIWSLGCVFVEMAAAPFSTDNSGWLNLRKDYNGKTGKHYWQDVNGLQDSLAQLLEGATCEIEITTVQAVKSMLQVRPENRPDATALTLMFTPAPCCLNLSNDKATYPGPQEEMSSAEQLNHVHFGQSHQASSADGNDPVGLVNAKEWLQQCSHNHDACVPLVLPNAKTLPTRLLDIRPGDQEATSVRLVESAAIDTNVDLINYAALSHVWSSSDVRLTSDSLEAMQAKLPRELLSEALNAAITTAQGLDYDYIWVDSLCVLQDSEVDKQQECANMASVFRNASVTLVLDQIENALQTIQGTSAHGQITKTDHLTPSAALPALDFTTPGFAWDTRAWALQERLLSTRFLHLTQEQLYWECNSLKASDTFPQGLSSLVWEKMHRKNNDGKKTEHMTAKKMMSNVKHTTKLTERKSGVTEYAKRLGPSRLRDCQRIKTQGDGVGDSMVAAQMAIKTGSDTVANANEEGNTSACHACTACCTPQQRASDKSTATDMMTDMVDHASPASSSTSAPLSSRPSSDAPNESTRQETGASRHMDQNGSARAEFDDGIAADARIKDDQIRRNIGGAGRTFRDDCREIWSAESRFGRSNRGRRSGKGMD